MIPLLMHVRIRKASHRGFGLWIPLFLIWVLLLPLVVVLLPFAFIALLIVKVNPFRAFVTGWMLLIGLRGTHIEVQDQRTAVLVQIY
jgi:hypothetical protein